jgi:hypothetical protein
MRGTVSQAGSASPFRERSARSSRTPVPVFACMLFARWFACLFVCLHAGLVVCLHVCLFARQVRVGEPRTSRRCGRSHQPPYPPLHTHAHTPPAPCRACEDALQAAGELAAYTHERSRARTHAPRAEMKEGRVAEGAHILRARIDMVPCRSTLSTTQYHPGRGLAAAEASVRLTERRARSRHARHAHAQTLKESHTRTNTHARTHSLTHTHTHTPYGMTGGRGREAASLAPLSELRGGQDVYAVSGSQRRLGALKALPPHDSAWASASNMPARGHVGHATARGGPVYDRCSRALASKYSMYIANRNRN